MRMTSLLMASICLFAVPATLVARNAVADTVVIIQNNFGQQQFGFQLVSTTPYNYQKLAQPPERVSLTFTQPVDAAQSSIKITDLYGVQVNDGTITTEGNSAYAALPMLPPGRYTVKWKIQCQCSGQLRLNDIFRFNVR